MARLIGPDAATRDTAGEPGRWITIYTDQACTQLADVATYSDAAPTVPGASIAGSVLTLDAEGAIPTFWFPDGVKTVWGKLSRSGPVYRLVADYDARLNALLATDIVSVAGLGATGRVPRVPQPSILLTTFQSGHGYTNNAGSTFNANDTSDFIAGTQAVSITTGGAGAAANVSKLGQTAFDATGKAFRVKLKVDNSAHLQELVFYAGNSSLASFYKWSYTIAGGSRTLSDGEWCTVTLNFADASVTGTPTRSALTDVRLGVYDDSAGAVTMHYQSVGLVPDASSLFSNGLVSICFDDIYSSQWTLARPKLDSYGYPASVYVIGDYLDTNGRLTTAQLKTLHDRSGWEIAAHASTGVNHSASWTGLTSSALASDFRTQRNWMIDNGLRCHDGAAMPLGQHGKTTDNVSTLELSRPYFSYVRTTAGRVLETFPPADVMRIRALSGISSFAGGASPSSVTTTTTGLLDRAKTEKAWAILVFHDIVSSSPGATTQILQSDFNAIIDKINSNGMTVLPVGDALRYFG